MVPVRWQIGDIDAIYHLNDVGAFIWNLLDGKTSVCDIAHAVCLEFDVALEDSERDTLDLWMCCKVRESSRQQPTRIHDAYSHGGDEVLSRFQLELARTDASRARARQCDH